MSIGVTVDSYVVYFERMKDEVRHGRTIRNSATRGFKATWRTILAADFVSFIAAVVLFVLSVGSVRGFALYLGLTTVLRRHRLLLLHPPGRGAARRHRLARRGATRSASSTTNEPVDMSSDTDHRASPTSSPP